MTKNKATSRYHPTESQYKGGAKEMYVTYDREQKTRGGDTAIYPKVKRVYIAGDVKDWKVGTFKKRTGREVFGVSIEYKQDRSSYKRKGYAAKRGETDYTVSPASVKGSSQVFKRVVEVPKSGKNVRFHKSASQLPGKYKEALQEVR